MEPIISSSNKGNIRKSVERVTTNESVKGCFLTKERKGKKIDWVDCDHCSKWAHLDCTENWRNLRKNNWLCEAHK